ncbi:hypothetical protein CAEBREN_00445 [Caenorhabditis brenneri]|uniref:SET domain-containing protein n=1 Tax=Caenorhabditis brenneri TaxID=135651 RepID=G0PKD7_CAEBE|nr:hypothetical protein CAEBREN_00445 [Caenorhabditis brenneri]
MKSREAKFHKTLSNRQILQRHSCERKKKAMSFWKESQQESEETECSPRKTSQKHHYWGICGNVNSRKNNEMSLVNHLCSPNCVTHKVPYEIRERDRIFIKTTEEIKEGNELLLDYQWKNFACLCDTPECVSEQQKRA